MNLHILENILAIEREGSITKAADKMYITQSAMNQQLLKLEEDLGTPLFTRSNRKMIPTYAGKIYIEAIKKILAIHNETYNRIRDIAEFRTGEIAITHTPERGALNFTNLYPVFHEKYPGIVFKIYEARVKEMEKLLLDGTVSLAHVSVYKRNPEFEYVVLGTEKVVLGVPITNPLAELAGEKSWKKPPVIDSSLLSGQKFVMNDSATLMRDIVDDIFKKNKVKPNVLFESVSTGTILSVVRNQIGLGCFPQSYVKPSKEMVYFSFGEDVQWELCIAYRKDHYLSEPEKYYIEISKAVYDKGK